MKKRKSRLHEKAADYPESVWNPDFADLARRVE